MQRISYQNLHYLMLANQPHQIAEILTLTFAPQGHQRLCSVAQWVGERYAYAYLSHIQRHHPPCRHMLSLSAHSSYRMCTKMVLVSSIAAYNPGLIGT